ncbi:MAG TPA: ABC transporter ATP-binding protein [Gammaproteobacteria bacterium]|nr:ABC transporter ATP-binding protein [Gammaproteobacteria bacterium]
MAILLQDVGFAYPDAPEQQVLAIQRWSVDTGERVFVHGPSGGGKSTLLNLLCGIHRAGHGQVSVLGQRLDQMSNRRRDRFRANHIGCVFQQFNLIPYLDAIDNIRLAAHFAASKQPALDQQADGLLSALGIAPSDRRKATEHLSIGQQQRVAIARALINNPQLLIADEPSSSLDQPNRDAFMALLMSLVEEHRITLIFVSHDLSLSHHFGRIEALADINTADRVG